LADPAPILQTLMADPFIARSFRLDGVVTLVDAANGAATLDAQPEAVRQAAVADRLVLTKTDIAGAEATSALVARLGSLNPGAPLRCVTQGDVEPAFLLHAGPYDPGARPAEVQGWIDADAWVRHDHDHAHAHHHDPNRHDARIHAFCVTFDAPLPFAGLATWLEMMVATRGESLLRLKGLLNLQGEDRPVVLHAVQHVFHPTVQLAGWPDGDDRRSRLVFILRDLPRAAVEDSLHAFLAAAESPQPVAAA
jgi:G3E family GTPase